MRFSRAERKHSIIGAESRSRSMLSRRRLQALVGRCVFEKDCGKQEIIDPIVNAVCVRCEYHQDVRSRALPPAGLSSRPS